MTKDDFIQLILFRLMDEDLNDVTHIAVDEDGIIVLSAGEMRSFGTFWLINISLEGRVLRSFVKYRFDYDDIDWKDTQFKL